MDAAAATTPEPEPEPPLTELQQVRGYPGPAPTPVDKVPSSGGWWFWPSSQPRPDTTNGKVISV